MKRLWPIERSKDCALQGVGKFPVHRRSKLLTFDSGAIFFKVSFFSFHVLSSQRSLSWKLLIPSHCHRSLVSSYLISSHLMSCLLSFFHSLSASRLISCSDVVSFFLISSILLSYLPALLSSSYIFPRRLSSALLSSVSDHGSSHLFSGPACSRTGSRR